MRRMRRILLLILLVAGGAVASAQSPTVVLKVRWEPNPAVDNVVTYSLYLDALPAMSVPTTVNTACACIEQTITVAAGSHTVKVTAHNLTLSTDPTSPLQEGPPLTVTFTLQARASVKNVRIVL